MNPTEIDPAAKFFADLLLPLHYDNRRRGIVYLDRGERQASYWVGVTSRTGGLASVHAAACDATALLDALGEYWSAQKDARLLLLLPYLKELCQSLAAPARVSASRETALPEFVYPLF
ncbi:hypothetical protein GHJ84_24210 [Sinorhizobium meliloti]|uniref:hypothetical protein n=1 Tax=Rhizobium meliloti TaxID=382 RepID=UPI001295566F|nr:hypothetical protein [Sinorhizobium meliloti]MQX24000.1 hypothetical protein [Sinorhizobium meliloti]